MEKVMISIIILGSISGLTEGAGLLSDGSVNVNAAADGTFLFTTSLTAAETPFFFLGWYFGSKEIISTYTLSYGTTTATSPEYVDRVTLFPSTGSLELRNLTNADSGEYNFDLVTTTGYRFRGYTKLNVYEPVSNVAILPKSPHVVEFRSVRLSCTSTGSYISFLWLNDTSEVTASDRVHLTDGGSTLTIVNVTHYDQKPFRCQVFNLFSSDTSDPVIITISSLDCSAGCIAGIVIACCVLIAGAVGGGFYIYVKKIKKKPQTPMTPVTGQGNIYANTTEMSKKL